MQRTLSFLIMFITITLVSGCIITHTPKDDPVALGPGVSKTFKIQVFPKPAQYIWYVDGTQMPGATLNTFSYMLDEVRPSLHTIEVRAGADKHTWNVLYSGIPITDLLNSLVSITGGTFQMGSIDDENGHAQYTTPVHAVTLPDFEIGAYEVTQAQFKAVMGNNPSLFQGTYTQNNPVENVTWLEAREFCTQLSSLTGRTFTLPSEAQWEYACRAGSTTLYSFGNLDSELGNYAWFDGNSGDQPQEVGTKLPNAWGLYDMHGSVFEYCLDSWHYDYTGAPTDGSAWEPDTTYWRVLRGGSWTDSPWCSRSAERIATPELDFRSAGLGFRVVAVPAE